MPRRARIVIPNCFYHVTQRGNYKQQVFFEDKDRIQYLKWMKEYSLKYNLKIFAYCLMDNHVHFIVSPEQSDSLARVFAIVHMRYAKYIHKRIETVGHLWQGRFFSCIMDVKHLMTAIRYVERNPVRKKMVKEAWFWPWSSAQKHIGTGKSFILLEDINKIIEINCWKNFLKENECEDDIKKIRTCTEKGWMFADNKIVKSMEKKWNIILSPQKRGRPKEKVGTDTNFKR